MSHEALVEQIRSRVLAARDDVVGIVFFGSFVRDEPYHDVDVLVVVGGPPGSLQERDSEMIALRRAIDLPTDVDVFIYTLEEFRRGLAYRFPFMLEIAFDGLVVYDAGGLSALLNATRCDVLARGIRRTETGGWKFPVTYRQPTPLSPMSNQDWAETWLADASRDLAAAEALFEAQIYERCVTHCQQAMERCVKAVLACWGQWEKKHYVAKILRAELIHQDVGDWALALREMADRTELLEPTAVWSRYPSVEQGRIVLPEERYGVAEARETLATVRHNLETARAFVRWWFQQRVDSKDVFV